MERVKGIEPSSQAWEAHVLPLNPHPQERTLLVARMAGVGKEN
jgi:hypothetical protein